MDIARLVEFGRREIAAIVVLLLLAGGVFAFAQIASEVMEGDTHAFDEWLLVALRTNDGQDPIGPQWLEIMMTDFTALGGIPVSIFIVAAAAGYLLLIGKWATTIFLIASVLGGTLLNSLLKFGFARPRPDLVAHIVDVHTASFPSGHAMVAAVTYLTLGALLSRTVRGRAAKIYVLSLSVLLTVLIGISRVYLGVHWPTDVLAGWCAGASWATLCWAIAYWLQRRGKIESEGDAVPTRTA